METIKELRRICQSGGQKSPLRFFSIYVTRCLLEKNISSLRMNPVILAAGAASCLLLLSGSLPIMLTGTLILQLWSILCSAAEEVRIYRQFCDKTSAEEKSNFGLTAIYGESILQYVVQLLMPLCLSFGLFKAAGGTFWLLAGMATALSQVLLLVMHHAQESALLRKINHERGAFVLREPVEKTPGSGSEKASLAQRFITILHHSLLYPTLGMGLLFFSLCANFLGSFGYLKLFLILTGIGSALMAVYTILRKLKNSDADKQFTQLFSSSKKTI